MFMLNWQLRHSHSSVNHKGNTNPDSIVKVSFQLEWLLKKTGEKYSYVEKKFLHDDGGNINQEKREQYGGS